MAEEKKAAAKAVKEAGEVAEVARKPEEEKAEKSAVIRAEEARLKANADERTEGRESRNRQARGTGLYGKSKRGSSGQRNGQVPGGQG